MPVLIKVLRAPNKTPLLVELLWPSEEVDGTVIGV